PDQVRSEPPARRRMWKHAATSQELIAVSAVASAHPAATYASSSAAEPRCRTAETESSRVRTEVAANSGNREPVRWPGDPESTSASAGGLVGRGRSTLPLRVASPSAAANTWCRTGASITPATSSSSTATPIEMQNSGSPAAKLLVPSMGSTKKLTTGSPSPLPAARSSAGRSPPSAPPMRAVGSRRRSSETMISSLARSCSVAVSWWEVLSSRARPSRSRPRRYSAAAWAAARAMSSRCGAEGTAAGGVRGAEVFILVRLARGDRPRAGGQGADGLPRLRPGSCSAQQVPQVRGHQEPVGVGGLAHAAEVLEAGVELRELAPAQPVLLAPVGAGPEGRQGALDEQQVG